MTDKNPEKIRKMFDEIAARYDFINGIISFGTHKRGKKQAIRDLPPLPGNAEILDLCTGTGDLAYFLKSRGRVTGLDFSQNMLAAARKKVPEADFILGDCTNLPFKDNSFDLVTIGFGLRNIENPDRAIEEIVRVLKPDGVLIFKWSEIEIPSEQVWKAIGQKPLFGHHSGKKSNTYWGCFMKGEK